MPNATSVDEFLAAPEADALTAIPQETRQEIASRVLSSLRDDLGVPIAELRAQDAHGWLLHALPERFAAGDPLAPNVAPVISAWLRFAARVSGAKLTAFSKACDEILPELGDAIAYGHHHAHDVEPVPAYVRETPKVGRNDPCPCGSGKKAKKCHGAVR